MRKLLLGFFIISALAVNTAAQNQDSPAPSPPGGLSVEDARQVREAVSGLKNAFGIQDPSQNNPGATAQTTATPTDHKTLGDAADKAMDMVGRMVTQAAAGLEKVAPSVWRIMVRQQYAKAIADLLLPWLLFVMCVVYYQVLKKTWGEPRTVDGKSAKLFFASVLPVIAGVIFFIWGAAALSESIKYLVNPEYYAIRDLLTMLLNKGQGL